MCHKIINWIVYRLLLGSPLLYREMMQLEKDEGEIK